VKILARVLFFIYAALVGLAVLVAVFDTPTGTGWQGVLGLVSAFIVGFPWSLIVASLHAGTGFANGFGSSEDAVLMWLFLCGSGINLRFLVRWAFRKRQPESMRSTPNKSLERTRAE
jgi:hypothetical protein